MSRSLAGIKRPVAQDQADWMERLNEDDLEFIPAKGFVEMSVSGPVLVGVTTLSKGPERVTDFDYFEIRGK